jgi:hypothetical protein
VKYAIPVLLALTACAGQSIPTNAPLTASQAVSQVAPEKHDGCTVVYGYYPYTDFDPKGTFVKIKGQAPYEWAANATVSNDMSNGMWVRTGEHPRVYVPGQDESNGGPVTLTFRQPYSRVIFMNAVAAPTSGYVSISVTYCHKE